MTTTRCFAAQWVRVHAPTRPMNSNAPSPGSSGRPAWLIPVTVLALIAVFWGFLRQRAVPPPGSEPSPMSATGAGGTTPLAGTQVRSLATTRPAPGLEAALDTSAEDIPITPELRQEREGLFQKLSAGQDATMAAVAKAFGVHGIQQPDVLASGWILAQHWAIAARAEALVEAKVEDPAKRAELAEVRRRILIGTAETEIRGLLGSSPDSRLFADVEGIGRALKDSPLVDADLLPNRAAARAQRDARRPKSDLPSEE